MADRIVGYMKLGHNCRSCNKPNADYMITFAWKKDNLGGTRIECWHVACMPSWLSDYLKADEASWFETLKTPPRS